MLRHDRLLARLQADRPRTSPTTRTRRGRCCSTSAGCAWDEELCDAARRAAGALPEPLPSARASRRRRRSSAAGCRSPAIAGDQQAALFGQACLDAGAGKNTYGTGSFVLLNTGAEAAARRRGPADDDRLGHRAADVDYALEASDLRHRRRRAVAARRARDHRRARPRPRRWRRRSTSNDGVYFVPALTGLGSPHWDPYARGTIVGLTRGTGARAPRARGARGDRLPDGRRGARAGGGVGRAARASCAPTAARRPTAG